jgi:hypothetical protein
MTTDIERLDEANSCHDDDPPRGAALLREVDAARLPPERWPSYSFLLNHVLGEKLGAWSEALAGQQRLLALAQTQRAPLLWRQLGAAAQVVGATEPLAQAVEALASSSGAAPERARELVDLAAAMYVAPSQSAADAGQTALRALGPVMHIAWPTNTALDAQAAACSNNIANGLLDRSDKDLRHGALRAALATGAELAERLWRQAGTWVQHERALYLRALASTALGEPHLARRHALDGLVLLDLHDSAGAEDVDRAFLELERWNACVWMGLADEAHGALQRAERLADAFNDAGLTQWFETRRQRLPGFRR